MSKPIQGVLKVRRPIHGILPLNSEGKQVDRLVNNVKAADSYKKLLCCLACLRLDVCMMCKLDSLMESTYVQAWENKLEYNYPMIVCCCMVDNVGVIYYDRAILRKADKAGMCKPCCTHMSLCPTCCDICGEGLVLHGAWAWSTELTAVPGLCCTCCKCWTMLPGLDDAEVLSAAINNARDKAMERAKSGVAAEAIP